MYWLLITGKRRFTVKLWKTFTDCFNCLPIAAIIDEKIFCCHGGMCTWILYGRENLDLLKGCLHDWPLMKYMYHN